MDMSYYETGPILGPLILECPHPPALPYTHSHYNTNNNRVIGSPSKFNENTRDRTDKRGLPNSEHYIMSTVGHNFGT
jgi:hypothetical protein